MSGQAALVARLGYRRNVFLVLAVGPVVLAVVGVLPTWCAPLGSLSATAYVATSYVRARSKAVTSYRHNAEENAAIRAEVRADLDAQAKAARARQSGADLIAAERQRQVEEEGWTPEHDAQHGGSEAGDLVLAALAYLRPHRHLVGVPAEWPWEGRFWKPTPDDRVRELVKAGALIAAEIDRLHAQPTVSSSGVDRG